MKDKTKANLEAAFAGESQAAMKYKNFAAQAEKDGKPNLARMFTAISYAEEVHASNHLRALGYIGDAEANLQAAIDGETYEVEEMYPDFQATAEQEEEKRALVSIKYALEAEKIHAVMYADAKKVVAGGADIEIGAVQICKICGYTGEGEAPDRCPVCGAPSSQFKAFA